MFSIFKKVKLEMVDEATLTDGTTIVSDKKDFEKGSNVFVKASDNTTIALLTDDYTLENGTILKVIDGVVSEKILPTNETELAKDEPVELATDTPIETPVEDVKEDVDVQTKILDLTNRIKAVEDLLAQLNNENTDLKNQNVELSKIINDKPSVESIKASNEVVNENFDFMTARIEAIKEIRKNKTK